MNIRGVASDRGPFIVRAQNFALGTTSADIQSVMFSVGGSMTYCKLIASNPTVIVEMAFEDKAGAEKVIGTFNGKKVNDAANAVSVHGSNGASRPMAVYYTSMHSNSAAKNQHHKPITKYRKLNLGRRHLMQAKT